MSRDGSGPRFRAQETLSDEQLAAIGLMTVEFAAFENWIESVIWYLMGLKDQSDGRIATSDLRFAQKIDIGIALLDRRVALQVEVRIKEASDQVQRFRSELRKLNEDRNTVVHGAWVGEPSGILSSWKHTARGQLRTKRKIGSRDWIIGIVERMYVVKAEMISFLDFLADEHVANRRE